MRGHVRQRGKTWSYVIDVGEHKVQRCDCGGRFWLERTPLDACPKCGGQLHEHLERRQRWTSGFSTRREAEAALTEALSSLQKGTYIPPTKMTVRDYLTDEWLPAVKATVKPSTYISYEMHVYRHINPVLGPSLLQRLSAGAINGFYSKLRTEPRKPVQQSRQKQPKSSKATTRDKSEKEELETPPPLSPLTVRRIHATLRKALGDAVKWGRIPRNPAVAADPPKIKAGDRKEMKTWTARELQAFLQSVKGTRLYPLWLVLATTGMRRGEALGLRWEDVDMQNARISVRQSMTTVGYEIRVGEPKTGRGRNISLDPATVAALKALRQQQREEQMLWKKAGYSDSGYVFRQENGLPYHPNRITKVFEDAVETSGQPRIRLHDLRHTFATLALGAGVHPKVVSERLGHASITITLDTYSHAIPALHEEAAIKIASLIVPS